MCNLIVLLLSLRLFVVNLFVLSPGICTCSVPLIQRKLSFDQSTEVKGFFAYFGATFAQIPTTCINKYLVKIARYFFSNLQSFVVLNT